jgi:alpha-tubulin suppressor-like RCC1 family protein
MDMMDLLDLPTDVLVVVLTLLDARSLARLACSCTSLYFAPTGPVVSALLNRALVRGRCCNCPLPVDASSRAVHLAWTESKYDDARRIAAGGLMCSFVVAGGRLMSCGRETKLSPGLLGRAHGGDSRVATGLVDVSSLHGVFINSVTSEFGHGCAVAGSGIVYTWGNRHLGRLGEGGCSPSLEPSVVDALLGVRIVSVSTGGNHCLAVAVTGEVFAWGVAMRGLCGNEVSVVYQTLPTQILSLAGIRVRSASAGNLHSLVVTEDGAVYSFGRGSEGQLGHRGTQDEYTPRQVRSLRHVHICSAAAGGTTSLALSSDGIVFGWGSGGYDDVACSVPVMYEELSAVCVRFIVAHGDARCAVSCTGEMFTWGTLPAGLLGHGMSVCHQPTPRRVEALECEWIETASFGSMHTLAVTRDCRVIGWGDSDMLGFGTDATGVSLSPLFRHVMMCGL